MSWTRCSRRRTAPESAISNKAHTHTTQHLQQLFNYLMRKSEKKTAHTQLLLHESLSLKNRKPHEQPEPNLIKSSSLEIRNSSPASQPARKARCLCARNRNEIYLKVPSSPTTTTTTTTPPMIGGGHLRGNSPNYSADSRRSDGSGTRSLQKRRLKQ